jgi:hypothetical protein
VTSRLAPDTSPVLAAFATSWHSSLDDVNRTRLELLLPRLAGTVGEPAADERRAAMATDWLVRTFTVAWLRRARLTARADELVALPALTSIDLVWAAWPIIEAAEREGGSVAVLARFAPTSPVDALDVATSGAAWAVAAAVHASGAWERAFYVAQAAGGRKPGWLAIREAAWDACAGASGGAAAECAADPAHKIARSGHRDARYNAAYRAARRILDAAFRDLVAELTESAFQLFAEMLNVQSVKLAASH